MTTILFAPQNDSHAETTALLAYELARLGVEVVVLDMDGVFHQGTRRYLGQVKVIQSHLATATPFYRLSRLQQLRVVWSARPHVSGWLEGVDGVVAFNDGSLQRLLLSAARTSIATDLVLDGMITNEDEPRSISRVGRALLARFGRALSSTSLGSFLPSEVGMFPVDRLHVAGEHSAEVLRAHGSRAGRLLESGLPRWPEFEPGKATRAQRVAYLTGAFGWHGDGETAIAQVRDVEALAGACALAGIHLAVRVHPRDEPSSYAGIEVEIIDPRTETITDTLRSADLVLSIRSTGLIEAVILGKPAHALVIHPRWSRFQRSFIADPTFAPIRSLEQLDSTLRQASIGLSATSIELRQQALSTYVAATGRSATQRIVSAIAATQAAPGR